MKHRLFSSLFTAMVGALAFTSCNSEIVDNTSIVGKKQMTFTASYDKTINSRTSLGSDLSVLWATDDAISVFDATDNNAFEISKGIGASTAEFNGTASEASAYYAVYPYQSSATISGNVISSVVIPAEQKAIANTFDPKANIMTAVSNSANNLAFKNVCSYAKITTTTPCKKIIFTAGDDDKIAGTFNMTVGADGIASATATSGVNAVTLVPSLGDNFAAGTYYIAINAGNISSLLVQCVGIKEIREQSIVANITAFTRGSIVDLGSTDEWALCLCPDENHPHMVDFGLPNGIKWACMNVGAKKPVEYGNVFMWASITPNDDDVCDYEHAPYQTTTSVGILSVETRWTKYLGSVTSYYKDPDATGEDALKTQLDPEDDAAHVIWKSAWRMPTAQELKDLINNCCMIWTTNYNNTGIAGKIVYKAKSEADKGKGVSSSFTPVASYNINEDTHIFLPAGGYREKSETRSAGIGAYYWTSTLCDREAYGAEGFYFLGYYAGNPLCGCSRGDGYYIRAVCQ